MKRIYWLTILLLIICCKMTAQTQQGYVKTKGRLTSNGAVIKGTRLSGATVTVKGKNAVVSGRNGTFSLSIPTNSYYLQNVQKQGYVLMDPDVLSRQYSYSKNPLVLVLEDQGQQADDRLQAMKKISRTLRRQLQDKEDELEDLKEKHKVTEEEYRKRLQEIYAQQESNDKLISEMAERYSRIDFDEVDEFNRRISSLILEGKLIEADSLINSKGSIEARVAILHQRQAANSQAEQELNKKQKRLEKAKALAQKEMEGIAQDCYSKFEIFQMQLKKDSAIYYITKRAGLDTTNVEWIHDVGNYLLHIADYKGAMSLYKNSIEKFLYDYGETTSKTFLLYIGLARTHHAVGEYKQALDIYQKTFQIGKDLYGEESPQNTSVLRGIGLLYMELDQYEEAEQYLMRALAVADNPGDSAAAMIDLASMEVNRSKYQSAFNLYEKVVELIGGKQSDYRRQILLSDAYNGLGLVCNVQDEKEKALEYYQKSLDIDKKMYGEIHPSISVIFINIGNLYEKLGKYAEAKDYYSAALGIDTLTYGTYHPELAIVYEKLGLVNKDLGLYDEALVLEQKALGISKLYYGPKHTKTARRLGNLGCIYSEMKDYKKALNCNLEALDILKSMTGEKNHDVSAAYNNIGDLYIEMEEYAKAEEYLTKSLEICLELFGEDNSETLTTYNNFGRLYNAQGDYGKAAYYVEKTLPVLIRIYGVKHPNVAVSYYNASVLLKKQGDYEKSLNLAEKANGILSELLPDGHPLLKTVRDGIEDVKKRMAEK